MPQGGGMPGLWNVYVLVEKKNWKKATGNGVTSGTVCPVHDYKNINT